MARAWLAGEATSVCEGCSKTKPKGGDGESVTPQFVSGWAITGIGFGAEAADTFLPCSKHSVAFLSIKPLQCPFANPWLGFAHDQRSGSRTSWLPPEKAPRAGCEQQPNFKFAALQSEMFPSPCELPELATEQLLLLVFFHAHH